MTTTIKRLGYRRDPPHRRTQRLSHELLGPAPAVPAKASLERWELACLDQGQTGSCTGHGTAQAIAISCTADGHPLGCIPSPDGIYKVARTLEKHRADDPLTDGGAVPSDLAVGLPVFGVRPMQGPTPDARNSDVWGPDDAPNPNVNVEEDLGKLLAEGEKLIFGTFRVDETLPNFLDQIKAAVAAGYAVGIGVFVDAAFFALNPASHPVSSVNFHDPNGGGHWICLDAYDGDVFSGPNSWGLGYGFGPLVDSSCPNSGGHWRATTAWMKAQAAQGMDVYVFKVQAAAKAAEVIP